MEIKIGKKFIGDNHTVFIIAELSGNHHKDYDKAIELIDAAVEAGVDAVKIQTYTPDTITIDSEKEYFQIKVNEAWQGQTLYNLYKKIYTPWEWQPKLKEYAESKGVMLFSTPFDPTAVDFLEKMNVEMYKIASFEVVDIPLLKRIGQTKKSVIISRGMASEEEIKLAIDTLKKAGAKDIVVLHCISSYPAKLDEMNLSTIADIRERFRVISGLSDHSLETEIPKLAVAAGARVIEKHLIISRDEGGPDAAFSLEPNEFKKMVKEIRKAETALGQPSYGAGVNESENVIFRKSLFVTEDIKKGEKLTKKNTRSIRPGHGLAPKHYDEVMGKEVTQDIERGTPLSWNLIEK